MKERENLQKELEKEFKWFHENPELSFEEYETTKRIKEILKRENIEILDVPLKTGVVAIVKGKEEGPVIAVRGDIDALPIQEETDLSYKSKVKGKMHACGHDYHLTSIIGTAILLRDNADKIKGTVKLIFQPAEEIFSGASHIIESGVLDDVSLIFGIHCTREFPVGTVGIREGSVSAAVDRFKIELKGFGTHAAHPELGKDPIVAGSNLVTSLQTIVSRNINPFSVGLISVTHFSSGNTWNVIPESVEMEGTMRTFKKSVQERIKKLFIQVIKNYTEAFEQKYEILWGDSHPFVDNDETLAKLIGEEVSVFADVKVPEMTTGGEDFSFYQGKVPGLFAFIGTGCPYEWHNPAFQIKDEALYFSINYYITAVDVMLKK